MDHLLLYSFTFSTFLCFVNTQDPTVSSTIGDIIGKRRNLNLDVLPHPIVHEYLGIPFAQPPVGERRFRKPEPKTSLDSPFYAQNHKAICPQLIHSGYGTNYEQSEDCLFLNVYVPEQPADKTSGHAVMIWVHGGGFLEGAANLYDGALMSAAGNVIVVTINYRVGPFGFLSTGDENAPGNFGLWDQRLAFQWVHDYIEDFGGDNQRVTIAGESAGAMSVIQHAMFPDNNGLFQRVLAQSGSMSSRIFDYEQDPMKNTLTLANRLGCPTTMYELMYCLREKSVDEYLSALKDLQMDVNFSPIMDGELMKVNPQYISKMSEKHNFDEIEFFRSVDILSGFNAYEGAVMLSLIMDPNEIETIRPTPADMSDIYLPAMLRFLFRKEFREELLKLVKAQYTNWTNPYDYETIRLQITKLAGDINFAVPALDMARLHKNSLSASRNFMYHFTPVPSVRILPTPSWIPGANHADEFLFLFAGIGILGVGEENAWEIELITKMITYWTNFIKSGDPNVPEQLSPYWPEYTADDGEYIQLEKNMSDASAKSHLYAEETNFWMHVFPDLVKVFEEVGSERWCGDVTAAANDLTISKFLVLLTMILFSLL